MTKMKDAFAFFIIVGFICLISNWASVNILPTEALIGMGILILISSVAWACKIVLPLKLPATAYASILGLILTLPWTPGSEWIISHVNKLSFLALATPAMAFAGIALGNQLDSFRKMSWRIVAVAMMMFVGTFVGSAVIAQLLLR